MSGSNPTTTAPLEGSASRITGPLKGSGSNSTKLRPPNKRCVIQVDDGRLCGSFLVPEQSWKVSCSVAGLRDDPIFTLNFVAKRKEWMGEPLGSDEFDDHTETYKLHFRPGLSSRYWPEHWMMEDYQHIQPATSDDRSLFPAVLPRCSDSLPEDLMLVFRFTCYDIPTNTKPNPDVWKLYKSSGIMEVLDQIWNIRANQKPSVIKVWAPYHFDDIQDELDGFQEAVSQQRSPWVASFARGPPWRHLRDPKAPMIDRLIDDDNGVEARRLHEHLTNMTRSQAEKDAIKARRDAKNAYYRQKDLLAKKEARQNMKTETRQQAREPRPEDQLEGVVEDPEL